MDAVYGSEHEDHALVVEARGSGSLPASPCAPQQFGCPRSLGETNGAKDAQWVAEAQC
jgi:hypothetical protein